jgi:8-oxo-dGTP pyrophosphatase MutT (NUDIX family)
MVRRPVRSEFAADVFVFPGGKVDPADHDPALETFFDAPLPSNAPDRSASRTTAIRELFEEAGVLLTAGDKANVDTGTRSHDALRRQLRAGEIDLKDIANAEDLTLNVSALHPFARWITPETMPRRYDTWFYVARMPIGQAAQHDQVETVEGVWISPFEALRRAELGTFPLVFVTRKLLQRMQEHKSIDGLLDSISAQDLHPVMPKAVNRADGIVFLVPGDAGY